MVREPEELTEVTRAKLRLRAVASRPAAIPAAMRVAPGILRLFRPERRPAPQTPVAVAGSAQQGSTAPGRTLLTLAGVAAAAVAAGFLFSRSRRPSRQPEGF